MTAASRAWPAGPPPETISPVDPAALEALTAAGLTIGADRHRRANVVPVTRDAVRSLAAAVEDPNPLWWDDAFATEVAGSPLVTPATMVASWFRPDAWRPAGTTAATDEPLPTHFDVKAALGLPAAVVVENDLHAGDPIRVGDALTVVERLVSVGPPKTTRLGTGRFWTIDVETRNQHDRVVAVETVTCFGYHPPEGGAATATSPNASARTATTTDAAGPDDSPIGSAVITPIVAALTARSIALGAIASRDFRPVHLDPVAAKATGVADVFLDTPTQLAWFQRAISQWSGPDGHLERLRLRMGAPVIAGDTITVTGTVGAARTEPGEGDRYDLDLTMAVGSAVRSRAFATVSLTRGQRPSTGACSSG